jgi:phage-related protein
MADKMSGLAMRSSVMEKTLANTGITVEELGEALGIQGATIDDINEKWATLDTNQRAAALGMAASMNEGQTANEEYKNSWAGLQAQIDIAKGRIERLAGEVLLPVLVPALQVAARVLNFLGDTISAVMNGPLGGIISVIGALVAGFALVVPAVAAVQGAMVLYEASLLPAITATWALLSPWLPFIAIGAAIVALIYEIGKAFGWWTDASSAIDAIWAGIQRLWSAFINHPDVVSFINMVKGAWVALQPAIFSVIRLVMSFFTNTDGSKFDAVRAFIDAVGMAWKAMTLPIRLVITVVKLFMTTMRTVYNNVHNIINKIRNLWQRLPGLIRSAISSLVSIITSPFRKAYNGVVGAVDRIKSYVQGLTNISLSSITDKIVAPFRNAYSAVAREVDKIKQKASSITGGLLGAIGLGFDYEGMMEELEQARKTQSYNVEEGEISIKQEIDFNFDFTGLPEGINEDQLVYLLKEAINDKGVINQLVNNPDFQSLDQKVKNRLALKSNRARGV